MPMQRWQWGPISQTLGVLTEYYDISIIAATLPILTKVFLPAQMPPLISAFYVVAGLAVSYITRPVGAAIWGHYSDRIGRRLLMIGSMAGMAIVTGLISTLPNYAQAGFIGLILLVVIRMFVGIFYGGEKAAGATYAQEWTPAKWRGATNGITQTGVGLGLLTASGTAGLFLAYFGEAAMIAYAWRYVFLAGLIPFIVVAIIRLATAESPIWKAAKSRGDIEKSPLLSLMKGPTRVRFLQSTLMSIGFLVMGGTLSSYVAPLLTNLPSRLSTSQALVALNMYAIGQIVVALVVGPLSQYVGRKRILIIIAIITIVTVAPATNMVVTYGSSVLLLPVMLLAFWLGCLQTAPYSVIDAYLTERFGTKHRASGAGLSYALGNTFAGVCIVAVIPSLHGLIGGIETRTSIWLSMAILCIVGSLIGLLAVFIGPETAWIKLEEVESKGKTDPKDSPASR